MNRIKTITKLMFDFSNIVSKPALTVVFILLLTFFLCAATIILNYCNAPDGAYSVLAAIGPIAAGFVNKLDNTKTDE